MAGKMNSAERVPAGLGDGWVDGGQQWVEGTVGCG